MIQMSTESLPFCPLKTSFIIFFFLAILLIFLGWGKSKQKSCCVSSKMQTLNSKSLRDHLFAFIFAQNVSIPFIVLFPENFRFWKKRSTVSCLSYMLWEKGRISKYNLQLLVSIVLQIYPSLSPPASVHSSRHVAVRPGCAAGHKSNSHWFQWVLHASCSGECRALRFHWIANSHVKSTGPILSLQDILKSMGVTC